MTSDTPPQPPFDLGDEDVSDARLRDVFPTPTQTKEGMPGTWSHCGLQQHHVPHRHGFAMNEGPYENVLCLGTPGDPDGYAEPVRLVYPEVK